MAVLLGCTSYDDSLSAQEQADLDASRAFRAQSGDLALNADGTYSLKGQDLEVSDTVNGQPVYKNINLNGLEYTIVAAKFDYGLAVYALNGADQFADIGSDLDPITMGGLNATQYAGKYFERSIDSAANVSGETSGAIILTLDINAGTLSSTLGPAVSYQWDAGANRFIGINATTGETIAYEGDLLIGHYQMPDGTSTNYGTFWGVGE